MMRWIVVALLALGGCGDDDGSSPMADAGPADASVMEDSFVPEDPDAFTGTVIQPECQLNPEAFLPVQGSLFWPEGWAQHEVSAPFTITSLSATLLVGAGDAFPSSACDPRLGVEVAVWVSDTETPMDYANGADPMTVPDLGSVTLVGTMVPSPSTAGRRETVTGELDEPIEVTAGDRLFIGYRLNEETAEGFACVVVCDTPTAQVRWQHQPSEGSVDEHEGMAQLMLGATITTP